MLNETHRTDLTSWVESAQLPGTDFPIQNLPFGVFQRESGGPAAVGVAIGDHIADLAGLWREGLLDDLATELTAEQMGAESLIDAANQPTLNRLMGLDPSLLTKLRRHLSIAFRADTAVAGRNAGVARRVLVPMSTATMRVPAEIGDYTDFYASVHHATNVGSMFRPDNPLLPNYKHVPIGYHGRASSIVPSGTAIHRPTGQTKAPDAAMPSVGPSKMLDYECELGAFIGRGNLMGSPVPLKEADRHLFGLALVNDWSARDIQAWEYQPLGPFLAKNFATTVSPWVVTLEALAPFRRQPEPHADGDPALLPYLDDPADRQTGAFDITLEVLLRTQQMRDGGLEAVKLSRASTTALYWTLGQMLAHHTMNGCNLRPGDLIASGTVSGPTPDARGCLLELTWRGRDPITLPTGETRRFLEPGDEVTIRGRATRDGFAALGFGLCTGVVG